MGALELSNMPQDMTLEEKEAVLDFITNGLPGIGRVQQSDTFRWFELYMAGKTYAEIATVTQSKKELVLYFAHKLSWMEKRLNHYDDINLHYLDKIKKAKLDNMNTLLTASAALGKYFGEKYDRYLATNDPSIVENMDTKMVAQWLKIQETISSAGSDEDGKPPGQSPLVNINMGSSATVRQVDPKTLEITDETAGDLLKSLASLKKANEDSKK